MEKVQIEDYISTVAPSLTESVIETISSICLEVGIESESDFDLLREDDLVPAIKPIIARNFLLRVKRKHEKPSGKFALVLLIIC